MDSGQMIRNGLDLLTGKGFRFSFDGIPLAHTSTEMQRNANLFFAGLDHILGNRRMLAMPPVLQIEPTNLCNLSCPLCPSRTMLRAKGKMSPETFAAILRDTAETLLLAILYGWGEPFLNEDLPLMVAGCTDNGILTLTSTNGHFLQTAAKAGEIVDAGLSALIVAVDGTTQESYSAYRRNGRLESVLRCVTHIEDAKARRNSATPFTNLRLVANRHNEDEIGLMEEMARDLGVNMFSVKTLGCLPDSPEFRSFEPASADIRRFGAIRRKQQHKSTFRCNYPFRQPTIFWDGTLVGCEFDYEMSTAWGNVNETAISDMWNGTEARQMRKSIRNQQHSPDFCRSCPYIGRGKNSSIFRRVLFR